MYLGYQNGKIKFYTEKELNSSFYQLEKQEYTDKEYVLDGDEYVLKDEAWEEKLAQVKAEKLAKLSLTKREVFLALYKAKGVTPEQLRSQILEPQALIEFDYANEYYRGNPLIDKIGALLGYNTTDLDYLFQNKEFPLVENFNEIKEGDLEE